MKSAVAILIGSLVALGAGSPANSSGAAWHSLAYGIGSGEGAIAEASVPGIPGPPAPNHRGLRFRVIARPASLRVDVEWEVDCGANDRSGGATYTGSFTKTFAKAPGCAGTLNATVHAYAGSGTVRVWIYGD